MVLDLYQIVSIVCAALAVFFATIDLILSLRKKRNVSLYKIVEKIPGIVLEAESLFPASSGASKLTYCLNQIKTLCVMNKVNYDEPGFTGYIESVLAAPQKKEDK